MPIDYQAFVTGLGEVSTLAGQKPEPTIRMREGSRGWDGGDGGDGWLDRALLL